MAKEVILFAVDPEGQVVNLKCDINGNLLNIPIFLSGTAIGGDTDELECSNINAEQDILKGKIIKIVKGETSYFRLIDGNLGNKISFGDLVTGTAASVVLGSHEAGEVTIVSVVEGEIGNNYTVQIINGEGESQPLTASLVGSDLIIYLATDSNGDPDNTINTATGISEAISLLDEFTATMTGSGGVMIAMEESKPFTGGVDEVVVEYGDEYIIY